MPQDKLKKKVKKKAQSEETDYFSWIAKKAKKYAKKAKEVASESYDTAKSYLPKEEGKRKAAKY